MNVIIQGLELSKSNKNDEHINIIPGWIEINKDDEAVFHTGILFDPKPHGRLIDMDRLMAVLASTIQITQSDADLFGHILSLIEHQPVIIEAENGK